MNNNHAVRNVLIRALWSTTGEIREPKESVMSDLTYNSYLLEHYALLYFFNVYFIFERERERETGHRRGAEREGDTESEAGSGL